MDDMTPTDKLRALLDERGIEWKECEPLGANAITRFCVNGVWLRYVDFGDYCWVYYHEDAPLTPEQAIAATVGTGYGITFAPTLDRPPETMVGETVYDAEGNAIGWVVNARTKEVAE